MAERLTALVAPKHKQALRKLVERGEIRSMSEGVVFALEQFLKGRGEL